MKSKQQKNISRYNTFEVFEDIYGQPNNQQSFAELDLPLQEQPHRVWNWLLGLMAILFITLAIHPLLAYSLKTPYPLVVIAEDTMQPNLINGDLVLSTGIINPAQIKVNDIVVFKTMTEPSHISVQRVVEINDDKLILHGDALVTPPIEISTSQVISKIVNSGSQQPLRIPFIGKLSSLLARI